MRILQHPAHDQLTQALEQQSKSCQPFNKLGSPLEDPPWSASHLKPFDAFGSFLPEHPPQHL